MDLLRNRFRSGKWFLKENLKPTVFVAEFLLKTAEKISDDYGNKIDVHPIAAEYGEGIEHLR